MAASCLQSSSYQRRPFFFATKPHGYSHLPCRLAPFPRRRRTLPMAFQRSDFNGFAKKVASGEALRDAWRSANDGFEQILYESRIAAERLNRRYSISTRVAEVARSAKDRALELDAEFGVTRRWRSFSIDFTRNLPRYRKELQGFLATPLGRKETLSLVRGSVQGEMSVRVVDQYEADTMYMFYLKGSPYRTMNPDEADLFYVPLAHYHVGWGELNLKLNKTGPAIEENLPRMLHYLNRTTANRHVQIAGHTGDIGCAYWYSQGPLLAPMYRLSLEHYANRGLKHYRSIIYPTIASGMDKQEVKKLMSAAATGPRPYFIMSLFGLHGSAGAVALRKNLHNQCTAGKKCLRDPVSAFEMSTASGRHGVYLKSTFCLEPPGDSPSRKAILDVMIAGCIPVLFWKNQTELWPYHVKSWDQVSILIEPENHHKTIDVLKAVSSERIQILQQNIIGLIPLLSYKPFGTNEDYDDAFEATLVGLWQEIRTSSS